MVKKAMFIISHLTGNVKMIHHNFTLSSEKNEIIEKANIVGMLSMSKQHAINCRKYNYRFSKKKHSVWVQMIQMIYTAQIPKKIGFYYFMKKKYLAHFEFGDCNTSQKVEILFTTV